MWALGGRYYQGAWQIDTATGVAAAVAKRGKTIENTNKRLVTYSGSWQQEPADRVSLSSSDAKNASVALKFKRYRIGVYGLARPDGGYARVVLRNSQGRIVLSSILDLYCKYPVATLKLRRPALLQGTYPVNYFRLGRMQCLVR
ncbi:hypothetical protein [uncultured Hymenobacter sp.]|uniref:hypothetical protein n=1 Tax=uncultured Hymenobacter sp. TaxID=170016 RepID=UPI0035CB5AB3